MSRRGKQNVLPVTYASLKAKPDYEHPIDRIVRQRVGRRDMQRVVADGSTAIVQALERRRRLWFVREGGR